MESPFEIDEVANNDKIKLVSEMWWGKVLDPSEKLTSNQFWWIVQHVVTACGFAFIANFILALILFQNTNVQFFNDFPQPHCIALVLNLCVLIDQKIWWVGGCQLMARDVLSGNVAPLNGESLWHYPKKNSKRYKWFYWFVDFTQYAIKPKEEKSFCARLCDGNHRHAPYDLFCNIILFAIYLSIIYSLYGQRYYPDYNPHIIAGFFGILQMIICVPFWALNTLASFGDRLLEDRANHSTV